MAEKKVYSELELQTRTQRYNMAFALLLATCAGLLQLISSNISSIRESQDISFKNMEKVVESNAASIKTLVEDITTQKVTTADLKARVNSLEHKASR